MISNPILLAAFVSVGLSAACTRVDPAAAPVAERNVNYAMPLNTVVFVDPSLSRNIVAEQTGTRRSATNTLVAWATLRNRTDEQVKLSVRTRFLDAGKAPLDDSGWSPVFFDRRGIQTYEIPSMRANAAYYYIEISQAR